MRIPSVLRNLVPSYTMIAILSVLMVLGLVVTVSSGSQSVPARFKFSVADSVALTASATYDPPPPPQDHAVPRGVSLRVNAHIRIPMTTVCRKQYGARAVAWLLPTSNQVPAYWLDCMRAGAEIGPLNLDAACPAPHLAVNPYRNDPWDGVLSWRFWRCRARR